MTTNDTTIRSLQFLCENVSRTQRVQGVECAVADLCTLLHDREAFRTAGLSIAVLAVSALSMYLAEIDSEFSWQLMVEATSALERIAHTGAPIR